MASTVCSFVISVATVAAPKSIEPSEAGLRSRIVDALRDAINGNQIDEFMPEGCGPE